jgi:hypothetical protein
MDYASARRTLVLLEFVGRLQPGERLCCSAPSGRPCVQPEGWASWLTRWLRGEGRGPTLSFIEHAFEDGAERAAQLLARDDPYAQEQGSALLSALWEARHGLDALAQTYKGDQLCEARIATLRRTLSMRVNETKRRSKARRSR